MTMTHKVQTTAKNTDLAKLQPNWTRPEFTPDDGIGPMASLYQAGDAIVAIAGYFNDQLTCIGSGVMISPGLMLTATHVLEEFPPCGSGPVLLTFLPDGAMRAWLPTQTVTCSGKSKFQTIHKGRKIISDLSIVSCSLHSEAHIAHPLLLAPLELCLPLPKSRLWAVGFRDGTIEGDKTAVTPFVSSGLVTSCFPHGRGERMPSPCVEVAMETFGGMSGGPVFNEDGRLVGIVSSSFDKGPSYVTLVWDALRLSIDGLPEEVWPDQESDLDEGNKLGLVKIKGQYKCDASRNITLILSDNESMLIASSKEVWQSNENAN